MSSLFRRRVGIVAAATTALPVKKAPGGRGRSATRPQKHRKSVRKMRRSGVSTT